MIDKILDLKDDMPLDIYNEILSEAMETKNARILFMLAYFVKNADVLSLSDEILKTDNLRYISFFMRSIVGIDKLKFLDKILYLGSEKDAYYCLFDNRDLQDEEIFKILDKCKKNLKYYFLGIYHYLITLDRFNGDILKKVEDSLKMNISEDNYKEILVSLKDKYLNENDDNKNEKFSNNKYIGRKNYIPDMIVLHSTASYINALKNFYDEAAEVSAHFLINTDGEIKQIVDLDDSAWANGTSLNTESDVYYRFAASEMVKSRNYNANYYTFSIEHVSMDGELTDEQYHSSKEVIKRIIKYVKEKYDYDFIIDHKHIVGHRDINPIVRTVCPGNKFPMDKLIEDLKKEI